MLVVIGDSDMSLRSAGWELLSQGLVTHVDMLDRAFLYLKGGDNPKTSSSGRILTMVLPRKRAKRIMRVVRESYDGTGLRMYLLPVLAAYDPSTETESTA